MTGKIPPLALVLTLAACMREAPREVGVDVFSNDTIPVKFVVTLSGSLAMALRANNFYLQPDKSLVMETPGSLIVRTGAGTALIKSYDSSRRIAVEPIGTPPDSTDAAIVGTVVKVTRTADEQRVTLAKVKP
jgi:hypothetical protein